MNITISINEALWSRELEEYNAQKAAESDNAATFAKRRGEPLPPVFVPLSLSEYVSKFAADHEAAISAKITSVHLATLAQQSPETIARLAKVTTLPDAVKDQLAAQVDAL